MDAEQVQLMQRLGLALFIGLLIGAERGWHEREEAEGARVAGIRTFALVGLLGGVWALLGDLLGPVLLGLAFAAFAAVMIIARIRAAGATKDYGVTTVIAALMTFALGALAVKGEMALAAAGGVITATLLGVKPILHGWLGRITYDELLSVLKLLVMSVVLLPVLPDRGYGPWAALNPYEIWLMVVLIAGVSFVGYATIRITGETRGVLLAGLAGGLVSSTAVAINFARLSKVNPQQAALLASGIGFAATTMFPRTLLVAAAIEPALFWPLVLPLGLATLTGYAASAVLWRRARTASPRTRLEVQNPFELTTALKFGALLAAIILLAHGLSAWWGDAGVLVLALLSGLADVDAINLSLARMAGTTLAMDIAALGIGLAVISNTLVKAAIALLFGARSLGWAVLSVMVSALLAGLLGFAVPR